MRDARSQGRASEDSPPSKRRRAAREDHLRNHDKILTAALELFDARGLEVPLREIGQRAGMSQAGVFRHFANREQLIIEVYDRAATALSDRVRDSLQRVRNAQPAERLDTLITTIVDAVVEHPSYGQLAVHGVRLYPDRITDPVVVRELTAVIGDAKNADLLASDITAVDLVNSAVFAAVMMNTHPSATSNARRVFTILRRGLSPRVQGILPMPNPAVDRDEGVGSP